MIRFGTFISLMALAVASSTDAQSITFSTGFPKAQGTSIVGEGQYSVASGATNIPVTLHATPVNGGRVYINTTINMPMRKGNPPWDWGLNGCDNLPNDNYEVWAVLNYKVGNQDIYVSTPIV